MQYEWYKEVSGDEPLEQGDIIEKCNFLIPDMEHYDAILKNIETEKPIDIKEENAIILSQSCDIENNKIDSIILCPIFPFSELTVEGKPFKDSKEREILRRGNSPAYHLLRKRLLPPYREHLSQSFARYFMRVGLPTDIPADDIKNYSSNP